MKQLLSVPQLLTLAGLVTAAAPLHAATLVTEGDTDIGIGYEGGAFDLHIHNHEPLPDGTEYAPDEAVLFVASGSLWSVPNDSAFTSQLGAAGTSLYVLPKNEQEGLLALGIGSEELSASDWTGNLTVTLKGVSGPGSFYLWDEDSFGSPSFLMNSDVTLGGGVTSADAGAFIPGSHNHLSFGFSQPGDYQITLEVVGTHAVDGLKSAEAVYSFSVQAVPEPASASLVVLGGLGLLALKRRARR
jgi:surface-anchored protein